MTDKALAPTGAGFDTNRTPEVLARWLLLET